MPLLINDQFVVDVCQCPRFRQSEESLKHFVSDRRHDTGRERAEPRKFGVLVVSRVCGPHRARDVFRVEFARRAVVVYEPRLLCRGAFADAPFVGIGVLVVVGFSIWIVLIFSVDLVVFVAVAIRDVRESLLFEPLLNPK